MRLLLNRDWQFSTSNFGRRAAGIASLAVGISLGLGFLSARQSPAANQSWIGGSLTDGNWNTGANWGNGAAPGSTVSLNNTDIATFNAVIANTWGNSVGNPIVIDSATQNLGGITFTGATDNYFVGGTLGGSGAGGNSLLLANGGAIQAFSVTSTNATETINAPLVLEGADGAYTFSNNANNGTGAGAATLAFGGGITGGAAGKTVLTLTGSNTNGNVINGGIGNGAATTLGIAKTGNGTWTLAGANTYTGNTTITAGTLNLNNNAGTGSLSSSSGLVFGGTGTFNYQSAVAGSSQTLASLSISAGQATVQSTYGTSGDTFLTFSSYTPHAAGATVNFVSSGGTPGGASGTSNNIVLGGQAAGFIDQGTFFGGTGYAYYDAGGFVRGINYGTDVGSTTSAATTSIASANFAQVTGAISAQTDATFTTLNISGNGAFTLAGGATVTTNGILKSGGNAATISGGLGIKPGANTELVIRSNLAADNLTINAPILANGTNSLTKTGAGTLTLGTVSGNAYSAGFTGGTFLDSGTVLVNTTAANALGTGLITLSGGTLVAATQPLGGAVALPNNIFVAPGTISNVISNSNTTFTGNAFSLTGAITGSGTLSSASGNAGSLAITGDLSAFSGTIQFQTISGQTNFSVGGTTSASLDLSQATLNLTGNQGSNRRFGLSNVALLQVGELTGTGTFIGTANGTSFVQVGAKNTDSTFAGNTLTGGGIVKVGTGTLTLNTATAYPNENTFFSVNGGKLVVDFANLATPTNLIGGASRRMQLGGGTLSVLGKGTAANTTQSLASLTINQGGSAVTVNANGAKGGLGTVFNLGNIANRLVGGTVDYSLPSDAGPQNSTNGITTTSSVLTNNVVTNAAGTAYATVNGGTEWASLLTNGTNNNIVPLSSVAPYNADDYTAALNNVDVTANGTPAAFTVSTLRFNSDGKTLTLAAGGPSTLGDGAILVTPNASSTGVTIGGVDGTASLVSGAGAELVIHNYGKLNVSAVIGNSTVGASALTVSGPGTTTLSNPSNTYTGITYINNGAVNISADASLGVAPASTVANQLTLNGGRLQWSGSFNLATTRGITLGNNGGTFDTAGSNSTYAGVITGGIVGGINANTAGGFGLTKAGSGTLTLTGLNTYGGATTVTGGVLSISTLSTATANGANAITTTITTAANNASATVGSAAGLVTGQLIVSPNVPAGTTITGISGNTITLSSGTGVTATSGTGVGFITPATAASSIGWAPNTAQYVALNGGTLQYTGPAVSTDRLFTVGLNGGTLDASGTGALNWAGNSGSAGTAPNAIALNGVGTHTLTLSGASTALNILVPNLPDGTGGLTSLVKTGSGTWSLANSKSYSGNTTISGGTLIVAGLPNTKSVTVSPSGILSGSGSIGGLVTLQAGNSAIDLRSGVVETLSLAKGLTLNSGNTLGFDLGGVANSDLLNLTGGSFSQSGAATVNIANLAGFGVGTYTLINGASGIDFHNFTLGSVPSGSFSYSLSDPTSTSLALVVQSTVVIPTTAYWKGSIDNNWSTNNSNHTNWATDATGATDAQGAPGSTTDVFFAVTDANGGNPINTTLDKNFTIKSLTFVGGTSAVTIGGTNNLAIATLAGITLNPGAGAATINTSGQVQLGADQTWTNNAANPLTVSSVISGNQALATAGSGTIVLSGANLYTGGTTINSGTLQLGNPTALGSGSLAVNGTLDMNGVSLSVPALAGNASGIITNSNAGGNSTASTLTVNIASGTSTYSGALNNGSGGSVALIKNGAGNLTLSGASTFSGGTTLNAGSLNFSNGSLGAGPIIVAGNNTTLRWNSGSTQDISTQGITLNDATNVNVDTNGNSVLLASPLQTGPLGTASLTKVGTGALSLAGANSYNGGTTVSAGQLNINNASAIGTGRLTLSSAATIDNTSGSPVALSTANPITINGGFTFAGSNTLDLGTGQITGATINLNIAAGNLIWSGPYTTGIVGGTPNQVTIKSGAGTLTLNSLTSTFNALWNFNTGTVNVAGLSNYGANGSLGNRGADTATDVSLSFFGGTLQYTGSTATSTNRAIRMGGGNSTTLDASGSDPSATMSFTAATSPALLSGTGPRTLTLTGSNTGLNTFNIQLNDQDPTTGQTSVSKTGAGTWVLSNSALGNFYSGNTTISGGILMLGNQTSAQNSRVISAVNNGLQFLEGVGQFSIGTLSDQVDAGGNPIAPAGDIALVDNAATPQPVALTISNTLGQSAQYSGKLTGSGSLTLGNGNLTLNGNNSYSGGTTINGGSLVMGSATALGPAGGPLVLNATLDLNGHNLIVGALSGGGTLTNSGAANVTFTFGDATPSNGFFGNINNGTGGGVTSIVKNGTATIMIGGGNSYTGTTRINQGTLALTSENISSTTKLILAGGKLATGGNNQTLTSAPLQVLASSTIDMGQFGSNDILHFADSTTADSAWNIDALHPGNLLRINNWTPGTIGTGSDSLGLGLDGDHIVFDVLSGSGLSAAQADQVHFSGYRGTAHVISTTLNSINVKELVPVDLNAKLTRGDLDGNGTYTGADLNLLLQALTNPAAYESMYATLTGKPALKDYELPDVADVNFDGVVDNFDLQAEIYTINNNTLPPQPGLSLGSVALSSGNSSSTAVPEPASLALLAFGGLLLGLKARRRRK